jgi:succinate dehydrogenase / fumarate reductase cytochrome b subunit
MALSLTRENYTLHKLHSLTGVIPTGFYMLQHLTLNSFSLGGPEKFNGVIEFFESVPKHVLLGMEIALLWIPILFHAVYGMMIVSRAQSNVLAPKYRFSQNVLYSVQRWSGVFLFAFLAYHVATTTGAKYLAGDADSILYAAWRTKLTENGYLLLIVYGLGVLAASYHFAYGIWNFCIRWGITVNSRSQSAIQRLALVLFIGVTLLGWAALAGFVFGQRIQ